MGRALKGFRRFGTTSGRWSLRPTAVSAPRVTSLVRVRYVRPVSIIHTHDIFTALKVVQRSISTPTHVRRRRFSYALGPRTFPPLISNRSRTVPPPVIFFLRHPTRFFWAERVVSVYRITHTKFLDT